MAMTSDVERSPVLPEPTAPALTFRGEKPSPGMVIRLWRSGRTQKTESRKRILDARASRRMEPASMVQLSPKWVLNNPQAAAWVQATLIERLSLESEQIARVGATEPVFVREALGFLERDDTDKEAYEAYLNEWRHSDSGVPVQVFNGKAVEDGEFGRIRLPFDLDMEGCPDFFDTILDRAYQALPEDERRGYEPLEHDRRKRKRHVRLDDKGGRKINPKYDKGDRKKSEQAHQEAVSRYLLGKAASHGRVIPALDCAPFFSQGRGRARWDLTALVERSLFYAEELLERGDTWKGLGDRKLIPMAYNADGTTEQIGEDEQGAGGQFFLYRAYVLCSADDGSKHPCIFWTVGGAATWDAQSGDEKDPASLGMIDLYDEYKREDGTCPAFDGHPLWSYHGGIHTEDDSPDQYWQPWIYRLLKTIQRIEGNQTSINAATAVNAFPGQFYRPDAALAEAAPEAFIEQDGELKRPKLPRSGEIEVAGGDFTPAVPATVSQDAWRQLELDRVSLASATASDQGASNPSGHALVVGETLAKVGLRQIREGVADAVARDGEDHVRILQAIYERHKIRWPIQTVDEQPAGAIGETRRGRRLVAYDPDWIGDGQGYTQKVEYPEEGNLALVDLEASLADRGYSSFENVQKRKGEVDARRERVKVLKDILWKDPAVIQLAAKRLAEERGDRPMLEILKELQKQGKITENPVPGMPNGVPTSALKRAGGGGPTAVSSARGGIQAGAMGTAANEADAMAQMQVGQGAAA